MLRIVRIFSCMILGIENLLRNFIHCRACLTQIKLLNFKQSLSVSSSEIKILDIQVDFHFKIVHLVFVVILEFGGVAASEIECLRPRITFGWAKTMKS